MLFCTLSSQQLYSWAVIWVPTIPVICLKTFQSIRNLRNCCNVISWLICGSLAAGALIDTGWLTVEVSSLACFMMARQYCNAYFLKCLFIKIWEKISSDTIIQKWFCIFCCIPLWDINVGKELFPRRLIMRQRHIEVRDSVDKISTKASHYILCISI